MNIEKLKDKGLVLMHGQWSNPVYAEPNGKPQIIFPGGDGWIHSFNPKNGELIWKFDCNPKDSFYKLGKDGTRNDFVCTPVVWENKLYIGIGQDPEHEKGVGHFWCIDITKKPKNKDKDLSRGQRQLSIPRPTSTRTPASSGTTAASSNRSRRSGRPYTFGRTLSTACVHDGLVYAAELDGIVHCFDAKTGEQYWEHDMEADTWASPYWVDGHIYIGNDKGKILVFKHGKNKELVSTIDMNSGYVRNTPVVVEGVLYVIAENPTAVVGHYARSNGVRSAGGSPAILRAGEPPALRKETGIDADDLDEPFALFPTLAPGVSAAAAGLRSRPGRMRHAAEDKGHGQARIVADVRRHQPAQHGQHDRQEHPRIVGRRRRQKGLEKYQMGHRSWQRVLRRSSDCRRQDFRRHQQRQAARSEDQQATRAC